MRQCSGDGQIIPGCVTRHLARHRTPGVDLKGCAMTHSAKSTSAYDAWFAKRMEWVHGTYPPSDKCDVFVGKYLPAKDRPSAWVKGVDMKTFADEVIDGVPKEMWESLAKPVFTEISPPERTRIYTFPGGDKVVLEDVVGIYVSRSGNHRIETKDGLKHIVPKGWLHISLDMDKWTF
jgi:hypothetical protein